MLHYLPIFYFGTTPIYLYGFTYLSSLHDFSFERKYTLMATYLFVGEVIRFLVPSQSIWYHNDVVVTDGAVLLRGREQFHKHTRVRQNLLQPGRINVRWSWNRRSIINIGLMTIVTLTNYLMTFEAVVKKV